MRVPLAWQNLTHDRRRLAVAVCGIGFAVVLMFMQTGFRNALFDSTVQILQDLNADIVLIAKSRYTLPANQAFPIGRIYQARACDGVRAAYPVYIERMRAVWKQPDCRGLPIRVIAAEPAALLIPELAAAAEKLKPQGAALWDVKSKSVYRPKGPRTPWTEWREATLAGRAVQLVGGFSLGTDFANDGNLLMNTANFAKFFPSRATGGDPLSVVDLGVVQLDEGVDVQVAKQRLAERLPDDVRVLTKSEMVARERGFLSCSTPIGYIFATGTMIGFLVGVIICYQIIHADVSDHKAEFATLKAVGYRNRYFVGFVLLESVYLSVLSFLPGAAVSYALYEALARSTGLLMRMTFDRAAVVFLLTLAMCGVSGCLAMRKILSADPASLF